MCVWVVSIHMWVWCRGRLDVDVAACHAASASKHRVPFSVLAPRKVNGPCMFFPQPWRLTLFMMDGKLLFFSLSRSFSLHSNFLFSCFCSSTAAATIGGIGCLCCLLCWFCRHCCYSCIFQIFSLVFIRSCSPPTPFFCLFNHFVI